MAGSNASRWENILFKKVRSTIIAIDALLTVFRVESFNIPQYAAFIDILVQNSTTIPHRTFFRCQNLCLYYQSNYPNNSEKNSNIRLAERRKIIINNYIEMLSLNSIILGGLEAHYLKHFQLKLENFSGKYLLTYTKDLSLMIKMTPSFYLKKEKK
jgi:hypothetical protein